MSFLSLLQLRIQFRGSLTSDPFTPIVIQASQEFPFPLGELCSIKTNNIVKFERKNSSYDKLIDSSMDHIMAVVQTEKEETFSLTKAMNIALWCQEHDAKVVIFQLPNPPEDSEDWIGWMVKRASSLVGLSSEQPPKPAEKWHYILSQETLPYPQSLKIPVLFVPLKVADRLLCDRRNKSYDQTIFEVPTDSSRVKRPLFSIHLKELLLKHSNKLEFRFLMDLQESLHNEFILDLSNCFAEVFAHLSIENFPACLAAIQYLETLDLRASGKEYVDYILKSFISKYSWTENSVDNAATLIHFAPFKQSINRLFTQEEENFSLMISLWCFLEEIKRMKPEANHFFSLDWEALLKKVFRPSIRRDDLSIFTFSLGLREGISSKEKLFHRRHFQQIIHAFRSLRVNFIDHLLYFLNIPFENDFNRDLQDIIKSFVNSQLEILQLNQIAGLQQDCNRLPGEFPQFVMIYLSEKVPEKVFRSPISSLIPYICSSLPKLNCPKKQEWMAFLDSRSPSLDTYLDLLTIINDLQTYYGDEDMLIDLVEHYTCVMMKSYNNKIDDYFKLLINFSRSKILNKFWSKIHPVINQEAKNIQMNSSSIDIKSFCELVSKSEFSSFPELFEFLIAKFITITFKSIQQNDRSSILGQYLISPNSRRFSEKFFLYGIHHFDIDRICGSYSSLIAFLESLPKDSETLILKFLKMAGSSSFCEEKWNELRQKLDTLFCPKSIEVLEVRFLRVFDALSTQLQIFLATFFTRHGPLTLISSLQVE